MAAVCGRPQGFSRIEILRYGRTRETYLEIKYEVCPKHLMEDHGVIIYIFMFSFIAFRRNINYLLS